MVGWSWTALSTLRLSGMVGSLHALVALRMCSDKGSSVETSKCSLSSSKSSPRNSLAGGPSSSLSLIVPSVRVNVFNLKKNKSIIGNRQIGGATHRWDTTLRRASALLQRRNMAHSVQAVQRNIRGIFPMGCGLGDSLGSWIHIKWSSTAEKRPGTLTSW